MPQGNGSNYLHIPTIIYLIFYHVLNKNDYSNNFMNL